MIKKSPFKGFGLGLRSAHYESILDSKPPVDWFEIISEDYLIPGGRPLFYLDRIREHYPMTMHGVSLSLGGTDPLNWDYLKSLKQLIQRVNPLWISDHCCWTGVNQVNLNELLPLPYTDEAVTHIASRIAQVQDFLERPLIIENVSSYITYKNSTLSEWDFLNVILEEADCLVLLDINNVYVSAFNHGFDAKEYLNAIPVERIQQFHLAGHKQCSTYIIDTHDRPIVDGVWQLYDYACNRFGDIPTLIERDIDIPPLETLLMELEYAKSFERNAKQYSELY